MDEPRIRTALSHHLIKFQRDEEEMVLSSTTDEDREEILAMYRKTKITAEDMMREYTPEEVQELCLRTKVRVKMYKLNTVWDSKRYLEKKKRLEKKSASWINRMLVKAQSRQMMEPYTDFEKEKYKVLAACQTKKDNNVRLDRWHRQRANAAYANPRFVSSPPATLNVSDSSDSEPELLLDSQPKILADSQQKLPADSQGDLFADSEPELLPDSQPELLPDSQPELLADSQPELLPDSQPELLPDSQADPQPELLLSPSNMPPLRAEPSQTSLESQSQLYECTMGEFIQPPVLQPSALPSVSFLNSEPNLWGIGDRDEQEEHEEQEAKVNSEPSNAVAETQLDSFDWEEAGNAINSESITLRDIASTQNTEPDYECFGTQVVAASTQDAVESQPFL